MKFKRIDEWIKEHPYETYWHTAVYIQVNSGYGFSVGSVENQFGRFIKIAKGRFQKSIKPPTTQVQTLTITSSAQWKELKVAVDKETRNLGWKE